MIYTGRRIFTDEGIEYVTRISFEINDIDKIEQYCFGLHFKTSGEKCWVYFNGDSTPFVIMESFDFLDELWKKSRFGKNINRIPNFDV